jgi:type VI secretion system secreted protein VgrG
VTPALIVVGIAAVAAGVAALISALSGAKADADKKCSGDPVGGSTSSCSAKPPIPKGCEYLDKPETVESSKADFDRIRKPSKLTSPKDVKHQFPGDAAPQDALEYEAEVDGRKVKIYEPKNKPKGKNLPSARQVADSLGAVPGKQLDSIKEVQISPNQNPDDAYWAKEYNTPGFSSAATGGSNGVTFYPKKTAWSQEFSDSTMIHEGGHTYSQDLWKDAATKKAWDDAIKSDPNSPSKYADNSPGEDFSESLVMYSLSKGTPCEDTAKKLYPKRYETLDNMFGAK